MTPEKSNPPSGATDEVLERNRHERKAHEIEEFGGGAIRSRHGRVNWWLLAVYLVLIVWAIYYGFTYWGGLGPGQGY
jgi:hypothetical protein